MLPYRRPAVFLSLACLLASLTACANSQKVEEAFAPDPTLKNKPVDFASDRSNTALAQLPSDFPGEIPRYPRAQLQEVTQSTPQATGESGNGVNGVLTRWVSSDPSNLVQSFYQNEFRANNWEIVRQPTDEQGGTFEARRNDLQLVVSIQPKSATITPSPTPSPSQTAAGQNPDIATEFNIQYVRNTAETPRQPPDTPIPTPQPSDPPLVGPVQPMPPTPNTPPVAASQVFPDLDKAPQDVRRYIEDLAALGVLPLEPGSQSKSANTTEFEPSKTITRREYARWLVAANNQIHANRQAQQIRGASDVQPAFQDVSQTDPDFSVIQGLAEAGLIPSSLSSDSTAVLFRPDAPLTREQLILWKVPLDIRQALPSASVDAVKQTWGFQDAAKIDPRPLQGVLADFQNSDQSNIRRVFGYTTLFQPTKPVTRAEAAAALWYFGTSSEGISAQEALQLKREQNQPSATSEAVPSSSANQ